MEKPAAGSSPTKRRHYTSVIKAPGSVFQLMWCETSQTPRDLEYLTLTVGLKRKLTLILLRI